MLNYAIDESANGLHFGSTNHTENGGENGDDYFDNKSPVCFTGNWVIYLFHGISIFKV